MFIFPSLSLFCTLNAVENKIRFQTIQFMHHPPQKIHGILNFRRALASRSRPSMVSSICFAILNAPTTSIIRIQISTLLFKIWMQFVPWWQMDHCKYHNYKIANKISHWSIHRFFAVLENHFAIAVSAIWIQSFNCTFYWTNCESWPHKKRFHTGISIIFGKFEFYEKFVASFVGLEFCMVAN